MRFQGRGHSWSHSGFFERSGDKRFYLAGVSSGCIFAGGLDLFFCIIDDGAHETEEILLIFVVGDLAAELRRRDMSEKGDG